MSISEQQTSVEKATDDTVCRQFFAGYNVVARAPACVFLFGNHSVVYGHLGLYLPVPRYTYVGLQKDPGITELEFAEPFPLYWIRRTSHLTSPNDPDFMEKLDQHNKLDGQNQSFIQDAYQVIRERFFAPEYQQLGLRMKVFCQAPTQAGMNSSGSIAAALIMALSTFFRTPFDAEEVDQARGKLDAPMLAKPYLRGSAAFEMLSTLAWFIDDCLHGLGGSAIGSLGSLLGSENGLPFIFMAEARTGLLTDAGTSSPDAEASPPISPTPKHTTLLDRLRRRRREPLAVAPPIATVGTGREFHPFNFRGFARRDKAGERFDRMQRLKRFALRLDDHIHPTSKLPLWWRDSGIAVVYGGNPKFTRDMLINMGEYLTALSQDTFITDALRLAFMQQMHLNPLEDLLLRTSEPPETAQMAYWYNSIGTESPDDYLLEWRKQHRKEVMMLLMGGTSYLGIEALFARHSYQFAEKLNQQQELFRSLGMSRAPMNVLCQQFATYQKNTEHPFGATITGGGGGGDIIVFGPRRDLEQKFDDLYEEARHYLDTNLIRDRDPVHVHYRSWLEPPAPQTGYPNVCAEPACIIRQIHAP